MSKPIIKLALGGTAAMAAFATVLIIPEVHAQDDEAVFDEPIKSTVRVRALSTGRYGTGWVVAAADDENRAGAAVIVTTLNTIEGSAVIVVREPNGNVDHDATILAVDTDRNLALLEVKDITAKQIPLTRTMPKVGRSVWATGYSLPADKAEGWRLAVNATIKGGRLGREYRGPISTEARADTNQIEHDAALVPGYEGGPVLDKCGRVIGVNMKSGGDVTNRALMRINSAAAIMNALRADEIIAFAKSKQVETDIRDGEDCGGASASAAPVAGAAGTAMTGAVQASAAPKASTSGSGLSAILGNPLFLGLLVLVGLAIAVLAFMAMSRKAKPVAEATPRPATPRPAPVGTALAGDDSTVLMEKPRPSTTRELSLRLSGHAPDGGAINIELVGSAIKAKPVMLGVGDNADVKVPDLRPNYKVSRMHALVGFDGTNFTIEDNKSLNGSKLNGKSLEAHQRATIVNGDVIMLADIKLNVSVN